MCSLLSWSFPAFGEVGPVNNASQTKVKLDFRNADLKTMVNFMAKLYGVVPVLPDNLTGKVNVSVSKRVPLDEGYRIVLAVMEAHGMTMLKTDTMLKVFPKADAVQKPVDTFYGDDPESVPDEDRVITHIAPIHNMSASDILSSIRPLISSTGNGLESRTTNMIILTDVASNIRRLLRIIHYLDVPQGMASAEGSTRVYEIKYMKAKDISAALEKVLGQGEQKDRIKITPVDSINAVVITGDMEVHARVKATIDALDKRRKQVLIQAQIVEVSLGKTSEMGVRLDENGYTDTFGNSEKYKYTATADFLSSFSGNPISYSLSRIGDDWQATIKAAASKGKAKILSSPRILTSDNQKAKIHVGQEEPIVKSTTDVDNGKTVSDIIYKDIGITLEVTPQINVERDVTLDVDFSITSILGQREAANNSPRIGKREASTSVTVMDGDTIVIGGLIKSEDRKDRVGIPLLKDIPFLGALFGYTKNVVDETELLVFLTPDVIETP
ncbi:MAG: hypothetical protein C0624_14755, partial [Desulfuromonas sp.]